jgi:hypothetical protein
MPVKRNVTAYMFFCQAHRAQLKRDYPNASFGELGALLGQKWRAMSESQKASYREQARGDKQRYEVEKDRALIMDSVQNGCPP